MHLKQSLTNMLLCIGPVLDKDALEVARTTLLGGRFVDGRATAGWHARTTKANLQADPTDDRLAALRRSLTDAILANELFQMAVRPRRLSPLILSRYERGMRYGAHVDDAMMGDLRADVSFTLFLSDPAGYAGGELVIDGPGGTQEFKLPPGSLVTYPSTTLHHVAEVTSGARYAAVGWAQSLIRDAARRELLFELDSARRALFRQGGKTAEFDLVTKSFSNLLRMWAEP